MEIKDTGNRREFGTGAVRDTICWKCQNTKCNWTQSFKPVEGWQAEKTIIENYCPAESFIVNECPEFISESENKAKFRETAQNIFKEAHKQNIHKFTTVYISKNALKTITDYIPLIEAERVLNCKIVGNQHGKKILIEGESEDDG